MCIPDLSRYAEQKKPTPFTGKIEVYFSQINVSFLFVAISVPRGNFRKPVESNECCDTETMHSALLIKGIYSSVFFFQ